MSGKKQDETVNRFAVGPEPHDSSFTRLDLIRSASAVGVAALGAPLIDTAKAATAIGESVSAAQQIMMNDLP